MTKEITKAIILQELQDKFRLRELVPETFAFSEMVIPTYDIASHLEKHIVKSATVAITSGPTATSFFVVPPTEKWHIHGYNIIFVTGVYTVAGMMVTRPDLTDYIYLDLKAAQSVSYAVNLPKDVILGPNDRLRIYIDGYTSSGSLTAIVDTTVEEIR